MPKISAKFQRGHPQQGRQIEVGYVKTAIFDQYVAISHKRRKTGT